MMKTRGTMGPSLPGVKTESEFVQQMVDLARVTRVVKGGKRMSFRACLVIGNNKGEIGYGVDKGANVSMAVEKALRQANKNLIKIPIINDTIPCQVRTKYKAAMILLRPASRGHGIVAGRVLRTVLSLAGIKNVTGKILGSRSKINNVKAVFKALDSLNKTIK